MRVLFAASPAIAIPALQALCRTEGVETAGVLTNPDSPKGRCGEAVPTEIGIEAAKISGESGHVIPVLKPVKLDAQVREQVSGLKPDLLVSFAYGHIFGPKFLGLFPLGGINIHPSLLPKYRGPSPIQAAILNMEKETGICIQTLAAEMDSGDILAMEKVALNGKETTASLSETMAQKAAEMLPGVLEKIAKGETAGTPQNHSEATYCSVFAKQDGFIDWNKTAAQIDAKVRSFNPWPLCRSIHNGREVLLLKTSVYNKDDKNDAPAGLVLGIDKEHGILVQTKEGILAVTELQFSGKKPLFWRDFLNGARDFTGSQLT